MVSDKPICGAFAPPTGLERGEYCDLTDNRNKILSKTVMLLQISVRIYCNMYLIAVIKAEFSASLL